MGCVYEATDPHGRKVALKMMSAQAAAQPDYREMFTHEVQSLKKLSNPSAVKIVGEPFSDGSGNLFLPMEFVEGRTIAQVVQANGPFDEQEALAVFGKILDAFAYIHSKACIHRDVKPSNVMIRSDGSVCVIDFGIAKDSKTSTGKTIGRIIGTDGYMSPEQANGYNIDTRTDIYSLGCLLHYMLTGTHAIPKQSNDYETICSILENKFPLVSEAGITVSDKTQQAILKAVDKNMTLRFQTAEEFKAALMDNVYKVTVGRSNCDIDLHSEYVSGRHLDILCEVLNEKGATYKFTIKDHSTNGTGVNGRKLKGEEYSFRVDRSIQSLMADSSSLPLVMIAGLEKYTLNWGRVLNILFDRMGLPTEVIADDDVFDEDDKLPPVNMEDISVGYGILSFLVPIAGWILGYVWKSQSPVKAKKANKLAWFGFLFNIITSFFYLI